MEQLRKTPVNPTVKPRTSRAVAPRPTKATKTITAPYDTADYLKTEGDMVFNALQNRQGSALQK